MAERKRCIGGAFGPSGPNGPETTSRGRRSVIIDAAFKDENGQTLGKLTANEKVFASGSRGYFGQGKIEIAGKRYQVQVQMVEIGSKGRKEQ